MKNDGIRKDYAELWIQCAKQPLWKWLPQKGENIGSLFVYIESGMIYAKMRVFS